MTNPEDVQPDAAPSPDASAPVAAAPSPDQLTQAVYELRAEIDALQSWKQGLLLDLAQLRLQVNEMGLIVSEHSTFLKKDGNYRGS